MKSTVNRYVYFFLATLTYLIIHEGIHVIQAMIHGIYQGIRIHAYGLGVEVLITEPLTIDGIKLALFSGLSSIMTILVGYILFSLSSYIIKLDIQPVKNYLYYVILVFLLLDPFYIAILSHWVGGDINGITLGLNISPSIIRIIYFLIFSFNILLVYTRLYPAFVIKKIDPAR